MGSNDADATGGHNDTHTTNSLLLDPSTTNDAASASISHLSPTVPITPVSPVLTSRNVSKGGDLASPVKSQAAGSVPIPPPPNPRRHRSGVLMSRVRANSSGTNFQTGNVVGSKSFGDLNMSMSSMSTGNDEEELETEESPIPPWSKRQNKRVVSEGFGKASDEEDGMWDNSARFYHHMHSRPVSRAASRSTSPTQSPASLSRAESLANSASASPIYLRRSLTLPQNGSVSPNMSASLSPNHLFLQSHLPPIFPEGENLHPSHPSKVILTPTTQEWRELKEIRRLEGEDVDSQEDSSSSSDESRPSSVMEPSLGESVLKAKQRGAFQRPGLRSTMSVDFLPREASHTPDPGSPVLTPAESPTPERPRFNPVLIAPSPVMPETPAVPVAPDTPSPAAIAHPSIHLTNDSVESSPEIDQDDVIAFPDDLHRPVRFNSIGRRESLQAIRPAGSAERPGVPRTKTKREREREKLFKELDEELEYEAQEGGGKVIGVQEIGKGGGLGSRPGSMDVMNFPTAPAELNLGEPTADIFDKGFKAVQKALPAPKSPVSPTKSMPPPKLPTARPHHPSLSPTQPLKPSPLHASPLNAGGGLPTPESLGEGDVPILEKPVSTRASPPPQIQVANLETIRDYARSFVQPNPHHVHQRDSENAPSPPKSPRLRQKSRRRDTNRVSLVAGRVVQPFAIPPSTSLPPPERPELKSKKSTPSLQSFSPFRSPAPGSMSPMPNPPSFSRFDSTVSIAPSTGAPSECGTPTSETAGGLGGRGIDDYVILKEAGKGAYGLVMRAKVKGPRGEPVGDEVIIKYIIKARILADCWKKHKQLGPIPVEIHVMDQLRHLLYNPPTRPHPWDPSRTRTASVEPSKRDSLDNLPNTPDSPRSDTSSNASGMFSPTSKYIASEIRHSPERGHPNICKLLDFFEDREFYYLVMPRFGTGVDLFDRVESQPDGLDPYEVRSLLGQLADAVRFLHSNGIVHRDIKDENVILDGTGRCQLIDFGSSAHWRPGKRWDTFSGTLHYASPEILRGEMYGGKEQDIWALGVVGYVLLVGETPFSELPDEVLTGLTADSSAEEALHERCGGAHVSEGAEEDGGGGLEDAADFVRRCLEMETSDRPIADVLCQHKYLRGDGGWTGKRGWVGMGFK